MQHTRNKSASVHVPPEQIREPEQIRCDTGVGVGAVTRCRSRCRNVSGGHHMGQLTMTCGERAPCFAGRGGGPKINGWVLILLQIILFCVELILRGSKFNVTDLMNSELDSWLKYHYMMCQCTYGWMKADAMIATIEGSTAYEEFLHVTITCSSVALATLLYQ